LNRYVDGCNPGELAQVSKFIVFCSACETISEPLNWLNCGQCLGCCASGAKFLRAPRRQADQLGSRLGAYRLAVNGELKSDDVFVQSRFNMERHAPMFLCQSHAVALAKKAPAPHHRNSPSP
jgi:hypothetical protein